ncbi:MAG: DUF6624 domain-containing protein [Bacteroidota bacterium]
MNKEIAIAGFLLSVNLVYTQNTDTYGKLVRKADSLYKLKEYKNSADMYSEAFKSFGWKGFSSNRYNAACSWALANVPDSAFFNLQKIAKGYFKNYDRIIVDTDLESLHNDPRWNPLIQKIKENRDSADSRLNKSLVNQLGIVYNDDQTFRANYEELEKKFGPDSKELKANNKKVHEKDSINLIKVKAILDTYGWLGPEVVGGLGSEALFLVIQHTDIVTQEKYLPMLRDAVKNGKASSSQLGYLEDRIELRNKRKQIYGSQISKYPGTNTFYVSPLLDPDNVDKRRAGIGLEPLADYAKNWNITWNCELYKKELPAIELVHKEY